MQAYTVSIRFWLYSIIVQLCIFTLEATFYIALVYVTSQFVTTMPSPL